MKPKTKSSEAHQSPRPPPPPPTTQLHSTTFPQTQDKQTKIGSKEDSACTRLGGIQTDNHFQRITEYWY